VTTSAREQTVKARQTPKSIFAANRILFMTGDTPHIHGGIEAKDHAPLFLSRRPLEEREAELFPSWDESSIVSDGRMEAFIVTTRQWQGGNKLATATATAFC